MRRVKIFKFKLLKLYFIGIILISLQKPKKRQKKTKIAKKIDMYNFN